MSSPQRSAALCGSAASAPAVSSPPAALLLSSLLPSPPARRLPPSRHRSGVGCAGPRLLRGAPGSVVTGGEDGSESWAGAKLERGRRRLGPEPRGLSEPNSGECTRFDILYTISCFFFSSQVVMSFISRRMLPNN